MLVTHIKFLTECYYQTISIRHSPPHYCYFLFIFNIIYIIYNLINKLKKYNLKK